MVTTNINHPVPHSQVCLHYKYSLAQGIRYENVILVYYVTYINVSSLEDRNRAPIQLVQKALNQKYFYNGLVW